MDLQVPPDLSFFNVHFARCHTLRHSKVANQYFSMNQNFKFSFTSIIISGKISMGDVFKDFFCGWTSGIAQVISMLPFENIKVKLVSRPQDYTGYLQCIKKTIAEEGVLGFYKGMLTNLLGVGPQVSLQFGVTETLKKYIKTNFAQGDGPLPLPWVFFSGWMSGIPSAILITPLDHARFRVALAKKEEGNSGSVKTAINIYKQHGFKKLNLGFNSTLLRECICLSIYFCSYDFMTRLLNPDPHNVSLLKSLLSGGSAGFITWVFLYPFDYIKTLIQTDCLVKPRHNSMYGYLQEELGKPGSYKRLFRGQAIMLGRAFFVNAFVFLTFEMTKKLVYTDHSEM